MTLVDMKLSAFKRTLFKALDGQLRTLRKRPSGGKFSFGL